MFKEKFKVFAKFPQNLKKSQINSSMKSRGKSLWRGYAWVMPKKYKADENDKDNLGCGNGL